jgi:DNA repair protein RecN (Recombination protein N)
MLRSFSIKNLAVIDHLSLDLHHGLNLLTGETGAGKSIIVDAIGLLLGARGGADLIRSGERVASIEGRFELGGACVERVREILEKAGLAYETGEELLIRREIQSGGRSRIFANDQSVTAATLRALQPYLLEILGQGEQHTLAVSQTQLEMLDSFAGCRGLRGEVSRAYQAWKEATEALGALSREESERERVGDFLRFQIAELERARPRADEDVELSAEKALLAHAEKAFELCAGGYAELYESDQSVLVRLGAVRRRVQELCAIDGRVTGWLESLEAATLALTDVAEGLRGYGAGVDFSPERLDQIESRLAELDRLKRKYGRDLEGLIQLLGELRARLGELDALTERRRELEARVESCARLYVPLAERLSVVRRAAAGKLEARVIKELRELALEDARFSVALKTVGPGAACESGESAATHRESTEADGGFWSPDGADRVEFFLAANVGENPRPLARVASGGELSRVMLTLRIVCRGAEASGGGADACVSMVFDEIDTGIGGRTAEAVGRRLKALAAGRQVLCVTHQAQIARFADHHYAVSKGVEGGRTSAHVTELEGERRIGELARMIGGAEDVETTRETARWMLEGVNSSAALSRTTRAERAAGKTEKVSKGRKARL